LGPFNPEGTAAYVRHRLAKAGCEREVFASDARDDQSPARSYPQGKIRPLPLHPELARAPCASGGSDAFKMR
jgi:hypothetical protein